MPKCILSCNIYVNICFERDRLLTNPLRSSVCGMQHLKAHDNVMLDMHDDETPIYLMKVVRVETLVEGFEHPALVVQDDGTFINGFVEDEGEEYFGSWYRFALEDPVVIMVPYELDTLSGGWVLRDDEWAKKQRKSIKNSPPWVGWPYVVCCPFIIKNWGFTMLVEPTSIRKARKRKPGDVVYTLHPEALRLLRGGELESESESEVDTDEVNESSDDSSSSDDNDE